MWLSHRVANWQAACCPIVDRRDKFRGLLSTAADLSTFIELQQIKKRKNQEDNKSEPCIFSISGVTVGLLLSKIQMSGFIDVMQTVVSDW